jgi:hypothetical protein
MGRRYNHTMSPSFAPLNVLLTMFAGWGNRHQLDAYSHRSQTWRKNSRATSVTTTTYRGP